LLEENMPLSEQAIQLASGVSLRFVERGPEDGIPVLLLHGYTDSWRSFVPVFANLPADFRVIALSQRGHGDSDRPQGRYHPSDLAADAAEFLSLRGIPAAYVVGHSMGAYVAECLALEHPAQVLGLVLIGAFRSLVGHPDLAAMAAELAEMRDPIDPAFARAFQESTLVQPVSPAFLDSVVAESAKVPLHVWRSALQSLLEIDLQDRIGRIRVPTLIAWGDRDGLSSLEDQQWLARSIPVAELKVYEGAGHGLHWEEPARLAADLVRFLPDGDSLAALRVQSPQARR
jgi:pimeloyl-ACP methyl ester carboxylesterase